MEIRTHFADSTLEAIRTLLQHMGIPYSDLKWVDVLFYLLFLILISHATGYLVGKLLTWSYPWWSKQRYTRFLSREQIAPFAHLLPPVIIVLFLPFAFADSSGALMIMERLANIYLIIIATLQVNKILNNVHGVLNGFLAQLGQIILVFISAIVCISILINRSPISLFTGLGAFAAVLLLVFKDTLLGFVAGVFLTKDDMVRPGDWIEVSGSSINGIVEDISLTTVKVRNLDNTLVTIPPYTLLTGTFINWRAMKEAGSRRLLFSLTIRPDSISECTPALLESMKGQYPAIKEYAEALNVQDEETNNGYLSTNLGLIRLCMTHLLTHHPLIEEKERLMVYTLPPNIYGIPLQVYAFTSLTRWEPYESLQSSLLAEFVLMTHRFRLKVFQPQGEYSTPIGV
jgi:miniconductance mechanosensitive channel